MDNDNKEGLSEEQIISILKVLKDERTFCSQLIISVSATIIALNALIVSIASVYISTVDDAEITMLAKCFIWSYFAMCFVAFIVFLFILYKWQDSYSKVRNMEMALILKKKENE